MLDSDPSGLKAKKSNRSGGKCANDGATRKKTRFKRTFAGGLGYHQKKTEGKKAVWEKD